MTAVAIAGHIRTADGAVHVHTADGGDGAQRGGGGAGVGAGQACATLVCVLCKARLRDRPSTPSGASSQVCLTAGLDKACILNARL